MTQYLVHVVCFIWTEIRICWEENRDHLEIIGAFCFVCFIWKVMIKKKLNSGRNAQQIRPLFTVNNGKNYEAKPSVCQSQQLCKQKRLKEARLAAAVWFMPPLHPFQEFYEWKMSGDRFSKATMGGRLCSGELMPSGPPHFHFPSGRWAFSWWNFSTPNMELMGWRPDGWRGAQRAAS